MQTFVRSLLVFAVVLSVLSVPFVTSAQTNQVVVCSSDDGGGVITPDCGSGGSDDGDDDGGGGCCVYGLDDRAISSGASGVF